MPTTAVITRLDELIIYMVLLFCHNAHFRMMNRENSDCQHCAVGYNKKKTIISRQQYGPDDVFWGRQAVLLRFGL